PGSLFHKNLAFLSKGLPKRDAEIIRSRRSKSASWPAAHPSTPAIPVREDKTAQFDNNSTREGKMSAFAKKNLGIGIIGNSPRLIRLRMEILKFISPDHGPIDYLTLGDRIDVPFKPTLLFALDESLYE